MNDRDQRWLAERFEADRPRLRGVAYRMLGSLAEADDAVQEAWLRVGRARTGADGVDNLSGWLTTVVARVCLDQLRTRRARREAPLANAPEQATRPGEASDPEYEAVLADGVGLALLVVLDALSPAERLAFVLHDLFGMPFEEIAPVVGRTPVATRQLASRARRRVRGSEPPTTPELAPQRAVVDAFLLAARAGDFGALLAVLDPDVVLRLDATTARGGPTEIRGAAVVARQAVAGAARAAQPALVDGAVGVIVAPRGRLLLVLRFTVVHGRVAAMEAVGDRERLAHLRLAVIDG
jgi:RNA polymerase sigma-70 factor (ECF subfamily)